MKKKFIAPEVNHVALTAEESVMLNILSSPGQTSGKIMSIKDGVTIVDPQRWMGINEGWI